MTARVQNDPRGGTRVNSERKPGAPLADAQREKLYDLVVAGELGVNAIAELVGVSSRTVVRARAALREDIQP